MRFQIQTNPLSDSTILSVSHFASELISFLNKFIGWMITFFLHKSLVPEWISIFLMDCSHEWFNL